MAWLSRVNFTASDVLSYTDLNNLGNDIRAWGGNVNGGAYTLSNVVLSASSGTMATVIGGTGTTSTLTLRSTSGVGTTGADIIFQAGNNGASEIMRLLNGGSVLINKASTDNASNKLDVQSTHVRFYSGGATTDTNFHLGNADVSGGQGGYLTFHASAATPYLSIGAISQGVGYRNLSLAPAGGNVLVGATSSSLGKFVTSGSQGYAYQGANIVVCARFQTGSNNAILFDTIGVTNASGYRRGIWWGYGIDDFNISRFTNDGTTGFITDLNVSSAGNVGIGTTNPLTKLQVGTAAGGVGADGNTTLSAGTLMAYGVATSGAALTWNAYTNGGNTNTVMAQLKPRQDTSANYNLDVFCGTWNNNNTPGTAVATFQSTGNVGIGLASPATILDVGYTTATDGFISFTSSSISRIRLGYQSSATPTSNVNQAQIFADSVGNLNISSRTNNASGIIFYTNSATTASERMRIDSVGNVKVGGTADRATTTGTNQVVIFNGTAPVGTLVNGCSFYSTAGEMRVMDAAGNATLLSPHDSVTNEWIYDSSHTPSGKRLKINVERLLRFINDHFGLDCVHDLMEEA